MDKSIQIDTFNRYTRVSRETIAGFIKYEKLLLKANQSLNLIGKSTINEVWNRHFLDSSQVIVKSFIKNIHIAYSCSDLVISRSGAMAIEELKMFNKAMILKPYPNSANNHQKFNAIEIADNNAGELIEQQDIELFKPS